MQILIVSYKACRIHQRLVFKINNPYHNLTPQIYIKVYLPFDILLYSYLCRSIQFKRATSFSFFFCLKETYNLCKPFNISFSYVVFLSIHGHLHYIILKLIKCLAL